jgi:phosphoribosylformimino-5-aminoimidazole carboxamide ribotide isomerase
MSGFTVIPAIDLKDGRCVRLRQGRAEESTVYGEDPLDMARHWVAEGATWLHVVDLDGAFQGRPVHHELIGRIARAVSVPVQTGGGLRTDADVARLLDAGVRRVVLGTRALEDLEGLAAIAGRYGDHIVAGIDARDGWVQIKGWTETTARRATDLARAVEAAGVRTIIYTDTARDGMLSGVNGLALREACRVVVCPVIASGGVTAPEDIRRMKALGCANLAGAIVGKALYEERVRLRDLQEAWSSAGGPDQA